MTDPPSIPFVPVEGAPARVVLIDCHANDRSFVRDESFRALADQLRAEGVKFRAGVYVGVQPPARGVPSDARESISPESLKN